MTISSFSYGLDVSTFRRRERSVDIKSPLSRGSNNAPKSETISRKKRKKKVRGRARAQASREAGESRRGALLLCASGAAVFCRHQSINDAYFSFRDARGEYEETRGDDNLHAFTFERSDGTLVRDSRRRENVEELLYYFREG